MKPSIEKSERRPMVGDRGHRRTGIGGHRAGEALLVAADADQLVAVGGQRAGRQQQAGGDGRRE